MFGVSGWESDAEVFLYSLAEKLHMSVAHVRSLPNSELVGWMSYFKAQAAVREVQR